MPRRRELKITLNPLQLIVCVAIGLWLGAVAIALSLWLAWQLWPQQVAPLAQAVAPARTAPPRLPRRNRPTRSRRCSSATRKS